MGNHIVTLDLNGIGTVNPFRYRGYYFDVEIGLYYLQTRYYDPVTGRFLNADTIFDPNVAFSSYNLFAYCENNPVRMSDPTGNVSEAQADKLIEYSGVSEPAVRNRLSHCSEVREPVFRQN